MAANSDLQGLLASGQWNVASGKPVVSDMAVGDAAGITDGRSGSGHRWESAATPKPHWLVVDLGEVYWIEGVNLYVGDCEAGCESTCRSDEGLCSFKVEAWTGPATTLARVQSAATGWVSAGHSHKGEVTQSVANTAKRVIVIVGVALVMGESLNPLKLAGCAIGIGGVFLYSVIDQLLAKK